MMMRSYYKKKRLRDQKYLDWLAEQPPLVMGAGDTVYHHLKMLGGGGTGIKPPDDHCIPLADSTHKDVHHYGERRVLCEKYGYTDKLLRYICDRYRTNYLEGI